MPNSTIIVSAWVLVSGGAWEPSAKDMALAQTRVPEIVYEFANEYQRSLIDDLPGYTIQYQGIEDEGERLIYMNAACGVSEGSSSPSEFIIVLDGGPCYFRLKFNPENGEAVEMGFNGEA